MKLIMENWRKYVAEVENEDSNDCLYIFEGSSVNRVSFKERLNSLNESSADDFAIFLEDWGKSVDYQFKKLTEETPRPFDPAHARTTVRGAPTPPSLPAAAPKAAATPPPLPPEVKATVQQAAQVAQQARPGAIQAVTNAFKKMKDWAQQNKGQAATVALTATAAVAAGLCMGDGADPIACKDAVMALGDTGEPAVDEIAAAVESGDPGPVEAAVDVVKTQDPELGAAVEEVVAEEPAAAEPEAAPAAPPAPEAAPAAAPDPDAPQPGEAGSNRPWNTLHGPAQGIERPPISPRANYDLLTATEEEGGMTPMSRQMWASRLGANSMYDGNVSGMLDMARQPAPIGVSADQLEQLLLQKGYHPDDVNVMITRYNDWDGYTGPKWSGAPADATEVPDAPEAGAGAPTSRMQRMRDAAAARRARREG